MKTTKQPAFWFFSALCIGIAVVVSIVNLRNPYLWFDEAGQFWISMGLNHFSDPLSARGGLGDVLENNSFYNMDPGGFSVLLYLWLHISTNTIFVRLFPLLLFIGFSIVLCQISYKETKSRWFSFFILAIPFLLPYIANKAGELRAYSMEMLGISMAVLLLMQVKEKLTVSRVLLLSVVLSLSCTARYASLIAAFAISLRFVWILYKEKGLRGMIPLLVVYATPLVLTVGVVYFGMMRIQNANAEKMPYGDYILSNPSTLMKPLAFLFYALIALSIYLKRKGQPLSELTRCALLVSITFILLSAIDKYPWSIIRTMPATILIVFALLVEANKLVCKNSIFVKSSMTVSLVALSFFWIIMFERLHKGDRIDVQMHELQEVVEGKTYSKIFVSSHESPCVRHYYEYGTGRGDIVAAYPDKFYFQKSARHAFSVEDKTNYKRVMPDEVEADYYFMTIEDLPETTQRKFQSYNNKKNIYILK